MIVDLCIVKSSSHNVFHLNLSSLPVYSIMGLGMWGEHQERIQAAFAARTAHNGAAAGLRAINHWRGSRSAIKAMLQSIAPNSPIRSHRFKKVANTKKDTQILLSRAL